MSKIKCQVIDVLRYKGLRKKLMSSVFLTENEFFTVLSRLIMKAVRFKTDKELQDKGLEGLIRDCAITALVDLSKDEMIPSDSRVPPTSMVNLIEISIDDPLNPKVNLWPLVAMLYPMAKIQEIKSMSGNKLVDGDGGTLSEAINGGRFIDLT